MHSRNSHQEGVMSPCPMKVRVSSAFVLYVKGNTQDVFFVLLILHHIKFVSCNYSVPFYCWVVLRFVSIPQLILFVLSSWRQPSVLFCFATSVINSCISVQKCTNKMCIFSFLHLMARYTCYMYIFMFCFSQCILDNFILVHKKILILFLRLYYICCMDLA